MTNTKNQFANAVCRQSIGYADFPRPEITRHVRNNAFLLPGEY